MHVCAAAAPPHTLFPFVLLPRSSLLRFLPATLPLRVTMGTRGRYLCSIPAAIQGEGKIKGPKTTRKQFISSLYYCKRSLYTGNISSKTFTKWPSSQKPPPLAPQSAVLPRRPLTGVPKLSLPPHPPGLHHPNPISRGSQPLSCRWGAASLASASPASFSGPEAIPNLPLPPRLWWFPHGNPEHFPPLGLGAAAPRCNSEAARGQDQLETVRHQQRGS